MNKPAGPLSGAHVACALGVILIWGFNVVAIKLAVRELPALVACTLRFLIVGLVLLPWLRIRPGQMRRLFELSITFGTLNFGLLFLAIRHIDGTLVAIIVQSSVPMSLLLARFFLGERFGLVRGAGVALSFAGVVVLFGEPSANSHPVAVVVLLISLLAWSIGNIQLKGLEDVSPLTMQAWVSVFSAPVLVILSLLAESEQLSRMQTASSVAWAAVFYTAIAGSAIAHSLWYWLLRRYEVGQIVPFLLLQPIVATGAAFWILDERLGPYGWIGGLFVVVGVSIVQLRGWARVAAPTRARAP